VRIKFRHGNSKRWGKPLADIHGKPMIWWVYQQAKKVAELDEVIVAADDLWVYSVCQNLEINAVMTDDTHNSGVERLSEVAGETEADYYILIQGDEPLVEPKLISELAGLARRGEIGGNVVTFRTPVHSPVDVVNNTIIKVIVGVDDNMVFASRSAIPYPQKSLDFTYYKTVGVYCYPRSVALAYPNLKVGYLEKAEDHDLIRLLANGIRIKSFERETITIKVILMEKYGQKERSMMPNRRRRKVYHGKY
jgi:3-deoxy-manno-octulosonate cytidylyltransferase (CMP-KDO synthetase)